MTFVPTLYFSPATISLVVHIAFEEAGIDYRLEPILTTKGEQHTARYLAVHPLGRVPAVLVEPGVILTETPALLGYLAALASERELLPRDVLLRARADEWMSLCASTLHTTFVGFFRPDRYTDSKVAQDTLRTDSKERFLAHLRHVEARLPQGGFALGERYSLVDAYLCVFYLWAAHFELPLGEFERYGRLATEVLARPAVRRALIQEGLGTWVGEDSTTEV